MPKSWTYYQRQQIKQLIIEAEVQRFTREETIVFIKARSGLDISPESISNFKHGLRTRIQTRVNNLRKDKFAYIDQLFFKRIDELEKYQKELWQTIHTQGATDGHLKLGCINKLHQITITIANLYELLPEYCGTSTYADINWSDITDNQQQEEIKAIQATKRKPVF